MEITWRLLGLQGKWKGKGNENYKIDSAYIIRDKAGTPSSMPYGQPVSLGV